MTEQEYIAKRNGLFRTISSAAFESYNFYRAGMDELVYEAGLMTELEFRKIDVFRQQDFPIYYKDVPSKVHRKMDLVVHDYELGNVVLELKAVDRVGDINRHQLWSYMKLMNMRLGMLINFSPKGVYYEMYEYMDQTGMCEKVKI